MILLGGVGGAHHTRTHYRPMSLKKNVEGPRHSVIEAPLLSRDPLLNKAQLLNNALLLNRDPLLNETPLLIKTRY